MVSQPFSSASSVSSGAASSDERPWGQYRNGPASSHHERWLEQQCQAMRAARLEGSEMDPRDRLIEILWLVSRSIRATGDLVAARQRDPAFLTCARLLAGHLGAPLAMAAFGGSEADLERRFFDMFDALCDELQQLPKKGRAD